MKLEREVGAELTEASKARKVKRVDMAPGLIE